MMKSIKNSPAMDAAMNGTSNKRQFEYSPNRRKSQGKLSHFLTAVKLARFKLSGIRTRRRGADKNRKENSVLYARLQFSGHSRGLHDLEPLQRNI